MRWSADDVRHVAALARIEVDDAGAERLAGELTRILAYVDQIGEIEGGAAGEPGGAAPRRPDVPRVVPAEPLLAESAGRDGAVVRVPKVVGDGE